MKSIFGAKLAKAKLDIELDGILHQTTMTLDSFEIEAIFEEPPDDAPLHVDLVPIIDRYRIVLTGKMGSNQPLTTKDLIREYGR